MTEPSAKNLPRRMVGSGCPALCDRRRALVADDEPAIGHIVADWIGRAVPDAQVDYVANGRAALEAFRQGHHGLVILDLAMPIMDGRQTVEAIFHICEEWDWEKPFVMFVTGFAPPDFRDQFLAQHPECTLFLKPVFHLDLIRTVRDHLVLRPT